MYDLERSNKVQGHVIFKKTEPQKCFIIFS